MVGIDENIPADLCPVEGINTRRFHIGHDSIKSRNHENVLALRPGIAEHHSVCN